MLWCTGSSFLSVVVIQHDSNWCSYYSALEKFVEKCSCYWDKSVVLIQCSRYWAPPNVSFYPIIRLGDASYRMSEISWVSFMSLEYCSWMIRAKKWVRWSELWNTGVGLECRKWVGWVKCGLGDESLRMPENELGQLNCDCNFVPFHNWAENELGELGYM